MGCRYRSDVEEVEWAFRKGELCWIWRGRRKRGREWYVILVLARKLLIDPACTVQEDLGKEGEGAEGRERAG